MKKAVAWRTRGCKKLADTYYLTYTGYNNVDGPGRGQERCSTMPSYVR